MTLYRRHPLGALKISYESHSTRDYAAARLGGDFKIAGMHKMDTFHFRTYIFTIAVPAPCLRHHRILIDSFFLCIYASILLKRNRLRQLISL